ncbi:hypothetical protein BST81_00685 [Leptolyngbya sp. 'hensonii']|uniref:glycosyltransferase n=1 Tax=Leptolyngbya sp. 'hensonii' TaxID=1922337 RepID=UPI00094F64E2|nr:glycosyltransferase [Leptolyngbya sp. 'hensonii']OLP20290.1 hypothetical protein BST81_00685 [Leptolyngbya sp. 'hensonii']
MTHPLSVGVVVDLEWGSHAGGHVKCWERFAEAAVACGDGVDLTVYYLGVKATTVTIAPHVRYQILPPVLGTNRIPFLQERSRDTDLAPFNPRLAQLLRRHQVLHFTSAFTSSRTAHRVAHRYHIPLISSIHTDLPTFTRIYSQEIIGRFVGQGWLYGLLFDRLHLQNWLAEDMRRQWRRLLRDCDRVLVSQPEDRELLQGLLSEDRLSSLRRGIDKERFHPKHRDRDRLQATFGIPSEMPVLLFVGRVDDSKKVMTLAESAQALWQAGQPLQVLVVGEGSAGERVRRVLGPQVTLPGNLPQTELSWIYASADLFVFPSESEVSPNVVLEARASGLPVFVSARDGGAQFVRQPDIDGVLVRESSPEAWAQALLPFLVDPQKRLAMGREARRALEIYWPSWEDVFREDLLAVWQSVNPDR